MPSRNKLTNSSDETSLGLLISSDSIFTVPYFQRPYKWKPDKIKQLNVDILNIIDESGSHFMGAIIVNGRSNNPADPKPYDIIDGQQRITTIIIYLCAIVKILCSQKEFTIAKGLFLKYLVIGRPTNLSSNIKIHPCKEDRAQISAIYNDLLSSTFKKNLGGFKLNLMPATGKARGSMLNNYRSVQRFMKEQFETGGLFRITDIYTAILESISVVQIDVWDPTNGPKIFDALNSRQEPMTIGDLVRNEIFSRVSNEQQAVIEQIDEHKWQPFYKKFKQGNRDLFDSYFFPYGLIKDQNLKKSEVYNYLRESWEKFPDPEKIISALAEYQNAFIDIVCGTNLQRHDKDIHECFESLTLSNLPTSTYPFLVQLSNSILEKNISKIDAIEIIQCVESFLVRRALCGHEPTGLHAVFKRLWSDCGGSPSNPPHASYPTQPSATRTHVSWPTEWAQLLTPRALRAGAGARQQLLSTSMGHQPPPPWTIDGPHR